MYFSGFLPEKGLYTQQWPVLHLISRSGKTKVIYFMNDKLRIMKTSRYYLLSMVLIAILAIFSAGCTSAPDDSGSGYDVPTAQAGASGNLSDYRFITEEFAPMNYVDDGELKGISVDLLGVIFENAGIDKNTGDVEVMNWPDAYDLVMNNENTVLFTMAKTEERKDLFKWAGPIMNNSNALFGKISSGIVIDDTGDLTEYRIGAINDTSSFSLLADLGYPEEKIVGAASAEDAFNMLENGDIDLWATGEIAGLYFLKEMAGDPGDYEIVYTFEPYEFYYAFNKETPGSVIEEFRSALDEAKTEKDGTGSSAFDEILSLYT
jgi:polar amino acid transport system substrate-binding protein